MVVVATVLPLAVASSAQVGSPAGPAAPALGTVDTIAGPGACSIGARRDKSSTEVGAMTIDSEGRLFFDTGPLGAGVIARVERDGRVTRLVTGLGRPVRRRTAAAPAGASRLAADGAGGVMIAAGGKVVHTAANNSVTTINGLDKVQSIAADAAANLYVAERIGAESGTVRIRFLNRSEQPVDFYRGTPDHVVVEPGAVETIAGAPGRAGGGDGGPAQKAVIQGVPPAMAAVGGRLYIASSWVESGLSSPETSRVRLINLGGEPMTVHGIAIAPGHIETVAGGNALGQGGDGGQALAAGFSRMPGVAGDTHGNLFVADELNNRIRKVDPAGVVTTVAGRPGSGRQNAGFDGNDLPATKALLNAPIDVEVGPGERLLVADRINHQVRVVDETGILRAAPGAGAGLSWICTGDRKRSDPRAPPEIPQPGHPYSVTTDRRGNTYIANALAQQVVKVDQAGEQTTIAGRHRGVRTCSESEGCPPAVGDGGPAADARFVRPAVVEVTLDGRGLYIFDVVRVRFVNLSSRPVSVHGVTVAPGLIQTVVGSGTEGAAGDGAQAIDAQLGGLEERNFRVPSLAADQAGNLFIGDTVNNRVRRVDAAGIISTFAGTGATGEFSDCCKDPVGLEVGPDGEVYVADQSIGDVGDPHPRVWLVNPTQHRVAALGQQLEPGAVKPVAGTGSGSLTFEGDGGPAIDASLLRLASIALDGSGNLYIGGIGQHQEVDRNSQLVGGEGEVRRVDATGIISWFAGNGQSGYNGDSLKPRLTSLNTPTGLAFDRCGNLVIADWFNDRVRRLNLSPCPIVEKAAPPLQPRACRRIPMVVPIAVMGVAGAAVAFVVFGRARRRGAGAGDGA